MHGLWTLATLTDDALVRTQETWGDAVESQDESIEHQVQHMELVQQLHALLGQLPERQQIALKLSYGLDGHPPLRQYEVGSLRTGKIALTLLSKPSYDPESIRQLDLIEVSECTPGRRHEPICAS